MKDEIKSGDIWLTGHNRKIKILSTEAYGEYPVLGQEVGGGHILAWTREGEFNRCYISSRDNLVKKVVELRKKTVWIALVSNISTDISSFTYYQKEYAYYQPTFGTLIAVKEVEIVEGEGMDCGGKVSS